MYNTKELQEAIIALKKEKDVCILAHAYQTQDILEVADFIGDSFGLSQQAQTVPQQNLLMCGVRFMAETVKLLSPEKHVYLSNSEAGCPMAEQLSVEKLREMKKQLPDHKVVAYINTTSELKTECDVCVTSASALDILRKMDDDKILFIPDINLGSYVKSQLPEKQFELYKGGCPVHAMMTREDVEKAKEVAKATQSMGMNKFTTDAPVMIVISEESYNKTAGIGAKVKNNDYRSIDIGIATAYLTAEAAAQGLGTCILGWFDDKKIRQICGLKNPVRLVVSLGYAKEGSAVPTKKRKPYDELVSEIG